VLLQQHNAPLITNTMYKNSTTLFFLAIITIAVITTVKQSTKSKNCDDQAVIHVTEATLPYRTDTGTELSLNGIPRGNYQLNRSSDISQMEVSAVMLDPKQNLIKTVLMIGGDFADDTEFELTDSIARGDRPIKAKVLERISIPSADIRPKFTYLFAQPSAPRWTTKKIAVIELVDTIPISHLYIRKIGGLDSSWVEGNFVRTNEQIVAEYARKNKGTDRVLKTNPYTYSLPECRDN
jgi:hypothetical protein